MEQAELRPLGRSGVSLSRLGTSGVELVSVPGQGT